MPKGFYVSRSKAVRAIELLDAQTAHGSGFRFHPSVRNPKLSRYEPDSTRTLAAMLAEVGAWARFDTGFFRPGNIPVGDDLLVVADNSGLVCYLGIVHRPIVDRGGNRLARTVYNVILWAYAGWSLSIFADVPAGNPAREQEYISAAVRYAGATIVTTAELQQRITQGGGDDDGLVMVQNPLWNPMNTTFGSAGLNPLLGSKGGSP